MNITVTNGGFFYRKAAINAGLMDALKRGETKIGGKYEMTSDGELKFNQNNFVFTDKFGVLRVGRFTNKDELIQFSLEKFME